ncbi:hypothetical protein AB0G15_13670 [Streptosporangium sp. NPDC023825]|uniref:hypothetical protein n=1 Tax=Streptosporangium sp. NPDC023825 TaxID=3154909 RepID=UPI00342750AA
MTAALDRVTAPRTKVGLVAGGLGVYWPQFPGLLPQLRIGNTTSRVDFGCDPGEWTDAWSATGISHHWALGTGHRIADLRAVADLVGVDVIEVRP